MKLDAATLESVLGTYGPRRPQRGGHAISSGTTSGAASSRFALESIRPTDGFDVTCQASVPEVRIAFFESADYLDAIRNAISLGGDAGTQACIAGGVAETYYGGVPADLADHVMGLLDTRLVGVVEGFRHRFGLDRPQSQTIHT